MNSFMLLLTQRVEEVTINQHSFIAFGIFSAFHFMFEAAFFFALFVCLVFKRTTKQDAIKY